MEHPQQLQPAIGSCRNVFPAHDYDLAATLTSGQAFRWKNAEQGWEGVIGKRWVLLWNTHGQLEATVAGPEVDWHWLSHYLQLDLDLPAVVATFPEEPPLRAALEACRGLRLLRQDPWECLASFILSSSKQICQIQQIVQSLCERFGEQIPTPSGVGARFAFPSAARLAQCEERELRECKMGFRATYLLETAQVLERREIDFAALSSLSLEEARAVLLELPGVGKKIADCVLLFAFGFQQAFPVDVWVRKALQQLYFSGRRVNPRRLQEFTEAHFGPHAGYAQQYLFHYMRVVQRNRSLEILDSHDQTRVR